MNEKLLETVADISYIAGNMSVFSGDSRADINEFIFWAKEFESTNSNTNWDERDYITEITKFTIKKITGYKEYSINQ